MTTAQAHLTHTLTWNGGTDYIETVDVEVTFPTACPRGRLDATATGRGAKQLHATLDITDESYGHTLALCSLHIGSTRYDIAPVYASTVAGSLAALGRGLDDVLGLAQVLAAALDGRSADEVGVWLRHGKGVGAALLANGSDPVVRTRTLEL